MAIVFGEIYHCVHLNNSEQWGITVQGLDIEVYKVTKILPVNFYEEFCECKSLANTYHAVIQVIHHLLMLSLNIDKNY